MLLEELWLTKKKKKNHFVINEFHFQCKYSEAEEGSNYSSPALKCKYTDTVCVSVWVTLPCLSNIST